MKSELAAIKAAGKKYRGTNWPSFRRFQPGHAPTPASSEEVTLLCHAIEQALEVSKNHQFGDDTISFENDTSCILTRRFDGTSWMTEWTRDDRDFQTFPSPQPNDLLIEKILRHPKGPALEIAFQMLPHPIGPNRAKAAYPYLLLVIEPKSGMLLGFEMLSVEKTPHEAIPTAAVDAFLRLLDCNLIRPSALHVASPITATMLQKSARALGIDCHVNQYLPALDQAIFRIVNHFMR